MNDHDIDEAEVDRISKLIDKWREPFEAIEKALPQVASNEEIEALFMFIFDLYHITDTDDILDRANGAAEAWIYTLKNKPMGTEKIH